MTQTARDQLRSIVERIERLEEEIKDLNSDKSDIYKEARSNGFDVKVLRQVIALRKKDSAEIEEQDAIRDLYLKALGMIPDFEPVVDNPENYVNGARAVQAHEAA